MKNVLKVFYLDGRARSPSAPYVGNACLPSPRTNSACGRLGEPSLPKQWIAVLLVMVSACLVHAGDEAHSLTVGEGFVDPIVVSNNALGNYRFELENK